MLFAFDEIGLLVVIAGCFMGGFLPLMVIVGMTPEAKTFIKSKLSGGIIISKTSDAGYREFICAHPYGTEGQFIAGTNKFGQREIYVKPNTTDPLFSKTFVLKGIRRPIFDAYEGKTVMVPASVLAAISAVESGEKALPEHIKKWASENNISVKVTEERTQTLTAPVDPTNPDGQQMTVQNKSIISKFVKTSLFLTNPLGLKGYFANWWDQTQYDVMLQKEHQLGYLEGFGLRKEGAGAGGNKKFLIIGVIICLALAGVGIVLLGSGGLKL